MIPPSFEMVCEHDYHPAPMNCEKERHSSDLIEAVSEVVIGGRLNFFLFGREANEMSHASLYFF